MVNIEPLPDWADGEFFAMSEPPATADGSPIGCGEFIDLQCSATGAMSGKLYLSTKNYKLKGALDVKTQAELAGDPIEGVFVIPTDERDPSKDLTVTLLFDDTGLSGEIDYMI